jgi:hypothetical protein
MSGHRLSALILCLALQSGSSPAAFADSPPPAGSRVTAVQPPAWRTHDGVQAALMPGMPIESGDTLRTAASGRVYLALPELSTVKLGENTEFATANLTMTQDSKGPVFKSALSVLKGVFRFTTSLAGKLQRRDVEIQVATATIGIRGTDVWGRSDRDGALVALLEGKISMDVPGQHDLKMDQAGHYMTLSTAGQLQANRDVTAQNIADWAAQTDVKPGAGVLNEGGPWTIALQSSRHSADLQPLKDRLAAAGYAAEDIAMDNGSHPRPQQHRLVIRQVASYKDAKTLCSRIAGQLPSTRPWIYKTSGGA